MSSSSYYYNVKEYIFKPSEEDDVFDDNNKRVDDYLVETTEKILHIKDYEGNEAQEIKCKVCGSDKFIVGIRSYLTVIKCPSCEWELNIHEG